MVGRQDLYYGGTTYDNQQGLGVRLTRSGLLAVGELDLAPAAVPLDIPQDSILIIPFTRLYDQGTMIKGSTLLEKRLARKELWLHPDTISALGLQIESAAIITMKSAEAVAIIRQNSDLPVGLAFAARSSGLPLQEPLVARLMRQTVQS
jgi:hypothetical protein